MIQALVKPARQLLVIGGGFTGLRLAQAARRNGIAVRLTSRQSRTNSDGLEWLTFNSSPAGISLPAPGALAGITDVVVCVPPDQEQGDPALRLLGPSLLGLPLQWLGYLSTTGVYGDTGGAWVDETAPTSARAGRSQARVEAEQAWLATGLPVQIFRLPAIYGPNRSPFAALLAGQSRLIHKPGQVFCRVHVDDIVGCLLHSLARPQQERPTVVNVTDDCPCPSSETLGYAAHLLGHKLPPIEHYFKIASSMSPMARSFWSENRRISNQLLTLQLGYELRYPSYREGYRACLVEELDGGQSRRSPGSTT
ncbi:MAG: SDR family oxidoreductase [Cyanobacteria bacterium]|nr:SDR family oxidoreductase [Cyanobacteriota bacterium]MDA1246295.1 SDR family oxidoreductase [Cyanobacteriota bacterium]